MRSFALVLLLSIVIVSMFSVAPESAGRVFRESDCKVNASF